MIGIPLQLPSIHRIWTAPDRDAQLPLRVRVMLLGGASDNIDGLPQIGYGPLSLTTFGGESSHPNDQLVLLRQREIL